MGQRRLESRRFAVWQRDEIEAFVFIAMVGLAVVVAVMCFFEMIHFSSGVAGLDHGLNLFGNCVAGSLSGCGD